MKSNIQLPVDFNAIRRAVAHEVEKVTTLTTILEEPETQNVPRPQRPYFGFKITTPAFKNGDDTKSAVLDSNGNPTTVVNSGGVRRMSIAFDCYGNTHEEAYNFMTLWQTALDLEDIQEDLRRSGIAVWIIGSVADLSKLLNTGFEGRAHMDCTFGIAANLQSDLGQIKKVQVTGTVTTDQGQVVSTDTGVFGV